VASTVGTIMALLVVLTFLALVINNYVPVWGRDQEYSHMRVALGELGKLKAAVDLRIQACGSIQSYRSIICPDAFLPVTLGTAGIPIFSPPVVGTLTSDPARPGPAVNFTYRTATGARIRAVEYGNGTLELNVANRYYVTQSLIYGSGAITRSQFDGQFIEIGPQFGVVNKGNGRFDVAVTLVTLAGKGKSTAGSGAAAA
jgi:hypothetical protein